MNELQLLGAEKFLKIYLISGVIFTFWRSTWSHRVCAASLCPLSKHGCGTGLAHASPRGNGDLMHYAQSPKSVIWTLHILSCAM